MAQTPENCSRALLGRLCCARPAPRRGRFGYPRGHARSLALGRPRRPSPARRLLGRGARDGAGGRRRRGRRRRQRGRARHVDGLAHHLHRIAHHLHRIAHHLDDHRDHERQRRRGRRRGARLRGARRPRRLRGHEHVRGRHRSRVHARVLPGPDRRPVLHAVRPRALRSERRRPHPNDGNIDGGARRGRVPAGDALRRQASASTSTRPPSSEATPAPRGRRTSTPAPRR